MSFETIKLLFFQIFEMKLEKLDGMFADVFLFMHNFSEIDFSFYICFFKLFNSNIYRIRYNEMGMQEILCNLLPISFIHLIVKNDFDMWVISTNLFLVSCYMAHYRLWIHNDSPLIKSNLFSIEIYSVFFIWLKIIY